MCDNPYWVLPKGRWEKVPVPCGRCPPCRHRRANGWIFRLLKEYEVQRSACFVTLTYSTDHVPINELGMMTLDKTHLQGFFKRLRNYQTDTIRYFAVGEYGSKKMRPHYHIILFGLTDLISIGFDKKGNELFNSASVTKAWTFGGNYIGSVKEDSIAYVTKYIHKLATVPRFEGDIRVKEFSLMSKGIGANFLQKDSVVSYYQADLSRMFITKATGHKIALPRYYREKLFTEQQRDEQGYLAEKAAIEADDKLRSDYDRKYGYTCEDDFIAYKDMLKRQRYQSYAKNIKNRDFD